jgi:SET domain-containing protein
VAAGGRRLRAFVVRRSPIAGKGAFARRCLRAGERIVEYTGERISQEEADRRAGGGEAAHRHTVFFEVDEETVIDASRGGNGARFFNHCCEPNCESVCEEGRIFLCAMRDISSGEELTYDYLLEPGEADRELWPRLYGCACGTRACRGSLLDPKYLRRVTRSRTGRS